MRYYFLYPFRPQYFFPKGFKKHDVFITLFKPYTLIGAISWWLFRNMGLFRICFSQHNIEAYIPIHDIRKIVGVEMLMAFKMGTPGPDQKITALGLEKGKYFFIKYANIPLAMKNVFNEYKILKQLNNLDFVPRVKDFYQDNKQVLLKTNVLRGIRHGHTQLNSSILNCLFAMADEQIKTEKIISTQLKTVFTHGDFCPWNMMELQGRILIYDWEMAGTYPLGYDLFTFIFQTHFLLQPNKSIEIILLENEEIINKYFESFKISNWKSYLIEFAREKTEFEKQKSVKGLLYNYQILLNYAAKS